jgi:hypothetical protein
MKSPTNGSDRKESKTTKSPPQALPVGYTAPSSPQLAPAATTATTTSSSSSSATQPQYTPLVVEIEDLTLTAYIKSMTEFHNAARAVLKPLMKEANLERLDMVFRSFTDESFLLHVMTNPKLTK